MGETRDDSLCLQSTCLRSIVWFLLLIGCDMVGGVVTDKYCVAADPDDDIEYVVEIPAGTTSRSLGAILDESQIIARALKRRSTIKRLSLNDQSVSVPSALRVAEPRGEVGPKRFARCCWDYAGFVDHLFLNGDEPWALNNLQAVVIHTRHHHARETPRDTADVR